MCYKYCCQELSHRDNPNGGIKLFSGQVTTNTILKEINTSKLSQSKGNFTQIACCDDVIIGFGRAILILPMGTQLAFEDAFMYPNSNRTLYKDICQNDFHMEAHHDNKDEYQFITKERTDISSKYLRQFLQYL